MNSPNNSALKEWLNESIVAFSNDTYLIDIAFIIEINENNSLILVFNYLPEAYEDVVYSRFINFLESSYHKKIQDEEYVPFNVRMFDKSLFLYNISKFDPDILQYFVNDVDLIIGKEYYDSIKDNFIKENYEPKSESVILPYLEDVLLAWNDAHKKYISFDIQLTRCFFNALKLYHLLTDAPVNFNLTNISSLTDIKKLETIFSNIDFIIDKIEIGFSKKVLFNLFFEEDNHNILKKQILVEEFLTQLLEWIFHWIETNQIKEKSNFFSMIFEKLKNFIEDSSFLYDKFKTNLLKIDKNFG